MARSDLERFKHDIYEQFSRIGKAISSPVRLEILELLGQGDRTVEVLAKEMGASVANTSRHLQVLREARLVEAEKSGLYVRYRLAGEDVLEFMRSMRSLARNRLARVDLLMRRFLEGREDLEPIDRDRLLARIRDGSVTVLDVRPPEEYDAGHLPGAVSIPLTELERRIRELPREKEIVAYCRGPYCLLAVEAVEILRAKGFRATHCADGVPEWRSVGLPVETGEAARRGREDCPNR
jgi:rhodanese-related sulfurtransferase